MKHLLVVALVVVAACGANDRSHSTVTSVPAPTYQAENAKLVASIYTASLCNDAASPGKAGLALDTSTIFGTQAQPMCGSNSDCGGFGTCSSGSCGHCGSNSDCNGHGTCSSGTCNHCGSNSDCKSGTCSSGKCGGCGSNSDCKGNGTCSSGTCGHCGSNSDCNVGTCSSGSCGHCGSNSDCKGGTCSGGTCSNAGA